MSDVFGSSEWSLSPRREADDPEDEPLDEEGTLEADDDIDDLDADDVDIDDDDLDDDLDDDDDEDELDDEIDEDLLDLDDEYDDAEEDRHKPGHSKYED